MEGISYYYSYTQSPAGGKKGKNTPTKTKGKGAQLEPERVEAPTPGRLKLINYMVKWNNGLMTATNMNCKGT